MLSTTTKITVQVYGLSSTGDTALRFNSSLASVSTNGCQVACTGSLRVVIGCCNLSVAIRRHDGRVAWL